MTRVGWLDRSALALLFWGALTLFARAWLAAHPQDNPWAPLSLTDPPGWATARKLVRLRGDPAECRAVLARSGIAFTALPAVGEGECRRADRVQLADGAAAVAFRPSTPEATCALDAGLVLWLRNSVEPAAQRLLGSRVVALEHYGTTACRHIRGSDSGGWSEHATGNAIDVAGFDLADGRRITVDHDWSSSGPAQAFLHRIRHGACGVFGTVLSPDYNAAHADHFHLDQARSRIGWSACE
ncbi:MAG: extensin family protein [Novosphingobium sp.]|nr:extensin family protein [Novosphingobium sp.]